jgi:hypothetical protein
MAGVTGSPPPPSPPPPPSSDDAGVAGSVTGQWAQVYEPDDDGAPEPEPDEPRARLSPTGATVTALYGLTAILVVVGSFMPLFQALLPLGVSFTNVSNLLSMDAWHLTSSDTAPNTTLPTQTTPAPIPLGYPLLAAALLLAVVVVLRLLALRRPERQRLANTLGIAGAAYLTGLVFAVGAFEVAWRALSKSAAIGPVREIIGSGYWLLVTAAVLSIIATFAAYRRTPAVAVSSSSEESVGMSIIEEPVVPPGQPAEWPVVAVIPNDERTNW